MRRRRLAGGHRGIFINDEDWGLRPWAKRRFGADEGIGKGAYAEVFGLMRDNGLNLLWPAMHEGGYEFSSRPENFALADSFGITVGTSHCEPMLRNNCYLSRTKQELWSWVELSFDGGKAVFVEVPRSWADIGERDRLCNAAVQDNFIRVALPVPPGAKVSRIVSAAPGVVINRVGAR